MSTIACLITGAVISAEDFDIVGRGECDLFGARGSRERDEGEGGEADRQSAYEKGHGLVSVAKRTSDPSARQGDRVFKVGSGFRDCGWCLFRLLDLR
jgi:hypothetical protein